MSPHQVAIVHLSSERLHPIRSQIAELFCRRSLDLDPTLRALSLVGLKRQERRLMEILSLVLSELTRLDDLAPVARDLGRRHARHGVEDRHYATFGCALLWTLEHVLGSDFTLEVRVAWTETYLTISTLMMAGAADMFERQAA